MLFFLCYLIIKNVAANIWKYPSVNVVIEIKSCIKIRGEIYNINLSKSKTT